MYFLKINFMTFAVPCCKLQKHVLRMFRYFPKNLFFLQCGSLVLRINPVPYLCRENIKLLNNVWPWFFFLYFNPPPHFPSPALALSYFTTLTSNCADLPAPIIETGWIHRAPQIHVSCALTAHQQPIRAQDSVWQSVSPRRQKRPTVYSSSEEV